LANCPIPKGKELETIETVYSIISNDPEEVKKMTETAAYTFIKQGYEQGIEQGAFTKTKEHVIKCLSKRFNVPVPHDIQDSINSYTDLIALDSLFSQALDCESLDDFRSYLVR
jgi:hypothetical protein